jgi:hypothetical protein
MTRARLSRACLIDADLEQADLPRADLARSLLVRANLAGASLEQADLSKAKMRAVNLEGANLAQASLADADLRDANLRGANLRGARMGGAWLHGADLQGADTHPWSRPPESHSSPWPAVHFNTLEEPLFDWRDTDLPSESGAGPIIDDADIRARLRRAQQEESIEWLYVQAALGALGLGIAVSGIVVARESWTMVGGLIALCSVFLGLGTIGRLPPPSRWTVLRDCLRGDPDVRRRDRP